MGLLPMVTVDFMQPPGSPL